MRPKIPILLYCADDDLLAVTTYALRLHHYEVAAVGQMKDAINLAGKKEAALICGVLVHAHRGDPAGRLIHLLLETRSHIPLLVVDHAGDLAPVLHAEMVLYGSNTGMVHILAALRMLRCHRPAQKPRGVA
jgi:hypothetical protein